LVKNIQEVVQGSLIALTAVREPGIGRVRWICVVFERALHADKRDLIWCEIDEQRLLLDRRIEGNSHSNYLGRQLGRNGAQKRRWGLASLVGYLRERMDKSHGGWIEIVIGEVDPRSEQDCRRAQLWNPKNNKNLWPFRFCQEPASADMIVFEFAIIG